MVRPSKRRNANVQLAKQLLEAIWNIRAQKQIPNSERITRYLKRHYSHSDYEVEKQLQYAVKDGIIFSYQAVGNKGKMTGVEQEGFRIPDDEDMQPDKHDWYCFECHTQGDVLPCSDCWRVYHPSCTTEEWTGPKFTCTICKAGRKKNKMKRKMLNTLLSYTITRMKEKTRELHKIGHREEEEKFQKFFVYKPMDLNRIDLKVQSNKYHTLEEFMADTHLIYHNVYLIYGDEVKGGMTELARIMDRDCQYDVDEIKQCQNCYYMSNAKPKDWFCEPCDPPHELVYAKLKGYSFWPAKVIRKEGEKYDVRFFGGFHQRAVLPAEQIKSISISIKSLAAKRTAGFVKACEELKKHQLRLSEWEKEVDNEEEDDDEGEDENEKSNERVNEEEEEEEEENVNSMDTSNLEVSSTSVSPPKKRACLKAPTPEDVNVVTSSEVTEEKINIPKAITVSVTTQTDKKQTKSSHCQTDKWEPPVPSPPPVIDKAPSPTPLATEAKPSSEAEIPERPATPQEKAPPESASESTEVKDDTVDDTDKLSPPEMDTEGSFPQEAGPCNCAEKHQAEMESLKKSLADDHEEDKERALNNQLEQLKKDFEEDKQAAVSRAMSNMKAEVERVKRQTEEACKAEYLEEMKKLSKKHKEEFSSIKKKQWCYNCEEEAMYHCCWNTSYCSIKCQQNHWHKEHKKVCRRKRS